MEQEINLIKTIGDGLKDLEEKAEKCGNFKVATEMALLQIAFSTMIHEACRSIVKEVGDFSKELIKGRDK